ncbi:MULTISPECIES: H/ACA ribonucleoprotein complex subunit GAR1 [Candidatus Nitrosocaldus]|jgi:RNA-binding protein|uniref:H/ACA RNA-protein complex protein Gar1 n=1 Tax=Candidatus Nitrosocaldus cavascurensis TaxID=2058097 RepID=A0A2K5AP54_9ARCH|nr:MULTISPECIES: Gar1/Naf1 family protein [Candidatus Nitrosocaldus]GBC74654.1 hypothetical protein HRbin05_00699 [archaeon HR05]SPC33407.1 protein of unknown function [Candidatus Nitrosocaldus cavascurensis]
MREKIEVGEVLHVARSGRMIIKSSISDVAVLSRGTILVDAKGRSVAKLIELIGPVQSPYISAMPLTDRVKKYVGATLYVERTGKKVRRQENDDGKSKSKSKRVERKSGRREMMGEKREEEKDEEEGEGRGKEEE